MLDKDTSGTPGFTIRQFERLSVSYTRKLHSGFPPHRHPHYEVFWVTQGEGLALIDGDRVTIKPMTLFFINPGEVHNFYGTRNMGGVLMQFSPDFIATLDTVLPVPLAPTFWRPRSHPTLSLEGAELCTISQIFANIWEEAQSTDSQRDSVIKAHLFLFFNKVRQFYLKRTPAESEADECALTRRFQAAVRTDCPPVVTVKQFADRLGVSRSFLHLTVCRDTGKSPSDIIHERLMVEAKRLLLHTNADLAAIARKLGFGDSSYFGCFFRRHAKVSPRRFRQHQRACSADAEPAEQGTRV
jgi:AraC-like DNA-binding protein